MSTKHSLEDLFAIERETHLAVLLQNSDSLKSCGYSDLVIKKMFRAAHSLKGAARLVRKDLIEKQAHELEEIFKRIDESKLVSPENIADIDQLLLQMTGNFNTVKSYEQAVPESSLLHITSSHISELMQLSSELAVLTKRIDAELSLKSCQDPSLSEDCQRASSVAGLLQRLSYRLRLTALHEITSGLPAIALQLGNELGKKISLKIFNANTLIDRDLLRKIEPCLIQLLKNAIDHAFESPDERLQISKAETCQITISAKQCGSSVEIEFRDDGRGISVEKIRSKVISRGIHDEKTAARLSSEELLEFLFLPGFSTRDNITTLSGRGIGLDIVRATLLELGGDVSIKTDIGSGTTFSLRIPSRIASFRALIFKCADNYIGVPLCFVDRIMGAGESSIKEICGNLVLSISESEIPLADGATCLKLTADSNSNICRPVIVLEVQNKRLALLVDSLEEEREVVIHPLDDRYQQVEKVMGIAGGFGNKLVTIVNPEYLLSSAVEGLRAKANNVNISDEIKLASKILIVDDSLTVRELERRLLVQEGYECEIAVDGLDGFEKLAENEYSLVITDIDMPRLNGFELIERVRSQKNFTNIPLLVVSYKERNEDRERALSLGANAYLSKGSFKDDSFIQTVRGLIVEYSNG